VWISGWFTIILIITVAFIGYVLPWGQIRLWGATVITNLLSSIPVLGKFLVEWVWGGFFVSNFTLKLFFRVHFVLPFVIIFIIVFHLMILHFYGSSNLIGRIFLTKTEFTPIYTYKDILNVLIILILLILITFKPYSIGEPENFLPADPIVSPVHIKPEWYFLQYYAILRSIPRKVGGVICFFLSVICPLIIYIVKYYNSIIIFKIWVLFIWQLLLVNLILAWLGGCPVERPYLFLSQIFSWIYFVLFLVFYKIKLLISF